MEKKEKIKKAAIKLFVEKGFHYTKTSEIAKNAGVGEGTIYIYYKNKLNLARHIFDDGISELLTELKNIKSSNKSTIDKLDSMVDKFFSLFDQDESLYTYLIMEEHSFLKKLPEDYETPISFLIELLQEGNKKDINLENAKITAAFIYGLVTRVTAFIVFGKLERPSRQYKNQTIEACKKIIS